MLQNLLSIQGEGAGPTAKAKPASLAKDITIRGIGFRDAGATYMSPHGMPGGGVRGAFQLFFDDCAFNDSDQAVFEPIGERIAPLVEAYCLEDEKHGLEGLYRSELQVCTQGCFDSKYALVMTQL